MKTFAPPQKFATSNFGYDAFKELLSQKLISFKSVVCMCMSMTAWVSETNSQNINSSNLGESDVYGMNWFVKVLSGENVINCCEDLVIEFSFLPDENISGPQQAYAELRYFGDPDDLILENCSLVYDPQALLYKVIVDQEFPPWDQLPHDDDYWKASVTQVRSAYTNVVENAIDFSILHGVDDNGQMNGISPMEQLTIYSFGPTFCEGDEFNVQDLIDNGDVFDPELELHTLGIDDYGVFTVEQDLTIGSAFQIREAMVGPGSEIVVKDGATLEILNTDFIACKNKMWKGIHIEKGGHLKMDYCAITGAEYGISFERGAELTLENSIFQNNYVHLRGISDDTYSEDPFADISNTVFHEFSDNQFTSDDNDRYDGIGVFPGTYDGQTTVLGERPFAGLLLGEGEAIINNCGPITLPFESDEEGTFGGGNVFEKMANGILNRRDGGSLTLQGCKFSQLNSTYGVGYSEVGYGVRHDAFISALQIQKTPNWPDNYSSNTNTFEMLDIGVFSSISSILSVEGQEMSDVRRGIESSRTVLALQIEDNEIFSDETAISVSNTNLDRNFPFSSTDFSISNNDIELKEENPDPDGKAGIVLSNVIGAKGSRVNNNSLEVFYGEDGMAILQVENMAIKENTISDDGNVSTFTALHAAGGMNLFISCNQLSSQYTGSTSQSGDTHGLRIGSVVQSVISCNDISNTERGIRVFGNCSGTQIRGNTLDEHLMGVEYGYDDTAPVNYANTGRQEYNGNKWLSTYAPVQGEFGAKHNDLQNYNFSRFIVNDTEGAVFTTVSSPSDFVENRTDQSNFSCASFSSCGTPPGIVGGTTWEALDSFALVHDSIGSDNLLIEQFRDLQWQVYRRMQEGSLNSNGSFNTLASNLGLNSLFQDRESLMDIIRLDTLETTNFGQVDLDTVSQDYLWAVEKEILDWYEQMQNDLDQWSTTGSENIFMDRLSEGLSYTKSLWEGKAAYVDSVTLDECIPYGGQGWYLVNSLRPPMERNLGFDLNCTDYRFTEPQERMTNFEVYPNPNRGMMSIEAPSKVNTNQYRMYNASGQMVQEGTFVNGEAIRLNTEIQAGLYYITVGNAVQKISVVK